MNTSKSHYISSAIILYLGFLGINSSAQIINTIAGGGTIATNILATNAQLNNPAGIVLDANGNIYFCDAGFSIIRKISTGGIITSFAGSGIVGYSGDGGNALNAKMEGPIGIVRDQAGNTYFADGPRNVVRKISNTGIISTIAGTGVAGYSGNGGPAVLAQLNFPHGLAIDSLDNIYVADRLNNRIRKITPGGIISRVAGNSSTVGYSGDGGLATSAKLNEPLAVAWHHGKLYISDTYNWVIRKVDENGIITTIAGINQPFSGGNGGLATSAGLAPVGIDLDEAGNIYVADAAPFGGNNIRKINTSGIISSIAGTGVSGFSGDGGPATAAQLNLPLGIFVTPQNEIYVCDGQNSRIRKIDSLGIISTVAGITPPTVTYGLNARIAPLGGVGINKQTGNIVFADQYGNVIRKLDRSTGVLSRAAGNGTSGFSGDGGLAINAEIDTTLGVCYDTSGIYISDAGNNRIRKVNNAGIISTLVGTGVPGFNGDGGIGDTTQINFPTGLKVHNNELIFVDNANARIRKINLSTKIVSTICGDDSASSGGYGDGGPAILARFMSIADLDIDKWGNIYLADYLDNRIRKISNTGIISTVAGTSTQSFSGDNGLSINANLSIPYGVCADSIGNVYIFDGGNNRIRKVSAAGIITTIGGTGINGFSGDGGSATLAQIGSGGGMKCDYSGKSIIFCDPQSNRMREISEVAIPEICLVSTDSASTFNYISWDKTGYFNVDSFLIYREISSSPSIYAQIGAVPYDSLSLFIDTNRVYFNNNTLPNGDPNISTYRYKMKIRDNLSNVSFFGNYHNSVYFNNNSGTFTWNNYDIETIGNPVSQFNLLRDDISDGNWNVIGTTTGSQTTLIDPNYANFPIGNWRVEGEGFSCTPTRTNINTTRSNIKSRSGIFGTIAALNCSMAIISDTLCQNEPAIGIGFTVPYTGGNGGTHNGQTATSSGVLGLTATLVGSTFATGAGNLAYSITGTPTSNGFASFILNIGGQICTLSVFVDVCVGINENESIGKVVLFPNPCTSKTIINSTNMQMKRIEISDVLGKVVYKLESKLGSNQITIDTSNLQSGLYTIAISSSNQTVFQKLLIEQ